MPDPPFLRDERDDVHIEQFSGQEGAGMPTAVRMSWAIRAARPEADAVAALGLCERNGPDGEDEVGDPRKRRRRRMLGGRSGASPTGLAETLAALEPKRGRGWHSLRRKFASDLMDTPLKVLCELRGWKDATTVLRCYQRPDAGQLRTALEGRRRARG